MASIQPLPIAHNAYYCQIHLSKQATEPSTLFSYARVKAGEFPTSPSGLPLADAEVFMKCTHDPSEIQPEYRVETACTRFDIYLRLNAPEERIREDAPRSHEWFGLPGRNRWYHNPRRRSRYEARSEPTSSFVWVARDSRPLACTFGAGGRIVDGVRSGVGLK